MIVRLIIVLLLYCVGRPGIAMAVNTPRFGVARQAVAVFNQAAAAGPRAVLHPDQCGQVRQLEFIALPGTVFEVLAAPSSSPGVVQVRSAEYQAPAGVSLYVAAAALQPCQDRPAERAPLLPSRASIVQTLRTAVGLPYVWGGNVRRGVVQDGQVRFQGLDCSGLLYEATNGYTPRNTEQLVSFGKGVAIEGLGGEQLLQRLQPLDLLVWKGHVIIVLDQQQVIESILRCNGQQDGVLISPLRTRLQQLLQQRRPANDWPPGQVKAPLFVVRRWL